MNKFRNYPKRHFFLLTSVSIALPCLFTGILSAALISEDYEDWSVGKESYSGSAWSFIYSDAFYATTSSSVLGIESGPILGSSWGVDPATAPDSDASPAGGNFLSFSTGAGTWNGYSGVSSGGGIVTATAGSWESTAGHFYRQEKLSAGTIYSVNLWRQIQISSFVSTTSGGGGSSGGGGGDPGGFSVWIASGLNIANPLDTLDHRLAYQAYDSDLASGEWERVELIFQTPGLLGDPDVDIAFTMGLYSATAPAVPGVEKDGDPYTVDDFDPDITYYMSNAYYENTRYSIDGFELESIPEPGGSAMGALAFAGILILRRRGDR